MRDSAPFKSHAAQLVAERNLALAREKAERRRDNAAKKRERDRIAAERLAEREAVVAEDAAIMSALLAEERAPIDRHAQELAAHKAAEAAERLAARKAAKTARQDAVVVDAFCATVTQIPNMIRFHHASEKVTLVNFVSAQMNKQWRDTKPEKADVTDAFVVLIKALVEHLKEAVGRRPDLKNRLSMWLFLPPARLLRSSQAPQTGLCKFTKPRPKNFFSNFWIRRTCETFRQARNLYRNAAPGH
jgi:hypothetical protein